MGHAVIDDLSKDCNLNQSMRMCTLYQGWLAVVQLPVAWLVFTPLRFSPKQESHLLHPQPWHLLDNSQRCVPLV